MKKRETIMIAIIMSVLLICGCEEIMKHESGYNSVNVSLYDFDNKGETDELTDITGSARKSAIKIGESKSNLADRRRSRAK